MFCDVTKCKYISLFSSKQFSNQRVNLSRSNHQDPEVAKIRKLELAKQKHDITSIYKKIQKLIWDDFFFSAYYHEYHILCTLFLKFNNLISFIAWREKNTANNKIFPSSDMSLWAQTYTSLELGYMSSFQFWGRQGMILTSTMEISKL